MKDYLRTSVNPLNWCVAGAAALVLGAAGCADQAQVYRNYRDRHYALEAAVGGLNIETSAPPAASIEVPRQVTAVLSPDSELNILDALTIPQATGRPGFASAQQAWQGVVEPAPKDPPRTGPKWVSPLRNYNGSLVPGAYDD